jgi:HPt (histidine-containing phosphotransfer) domain-containing protein
LAKKAVAGPKLGQIGFTLIFAKRLNFIPRFTQALFHMQISFDKFNKLTMDDQEFARQLLEVYVGQFAEYIEEMDGYVNNHDLNKIRFLNHKIRSSVTVLEAAELLEEQVKMNTLAAREESPDKMKPTYGLVRQYSQQVVETLKQQLAKAAV